MGGRDKGLIDVDGRPAVARALELLKPLCDNCFISANRNEDRYASLNMGSVVGDLRADLQGPLAGIEAIIPALTPATECRRLLLLPCDLPQLSGEVPKLLLAELDARPDLDIVYAGTEGQSHYLCAALRAEILKSVRKQLDEGERAVHRWYALHASAVLLFNGVLADGFMNINTNEDRNLRPLVAGLRQNSSER
ncbi:MAG: molybdopterin-guanine dinucleotide biosynthesis protein A [Glaciecola sp.]|jgi:molybdopterin-guanine dinucleotide biosynthesis protein A